MIAFIPIDSKAYQDQKYSAKKILPVLWMPEKMPSQGQAVQESKRDGQKSCTIPSIWVRLTYQPISSFILTLTRDRDVTHGKGGSIDHQPYLRWHCRGRLRL